MSGDGPAGEDRVSLSALGRVVERCDRFEAAWRQGRRPRIEDYVAEVPEAEQPAALRELLAVELELRRGRGEQPEPEEYRGRFPAHAALIDDLFAGERSPLPTPAGRPERDRPRAEADGGLVAPGREAASDPDATRTLDATRAINVGRATSPGGRFRILRLHDRGGLGEVFVARDAELNREVALKQIQDRHAHDPQSRSRFVVEAEITGGLEHPGIVPIYGLGTYDDGRPFYAMRFIRGDSLKQAIKRFHEAAEPGRDPGERSLELRKLLGRFLDVCNAVAYAHSRGVLHRDLKPGNILLGPYGETLVVDWGLAKVIGRPEGTGDAEGMLWPASAGASSETLPGAALGTPAYMSPEQASGAEVGPAGDIYSLGATLYALLTGRAPIEGGEIPALLDRARRGDFPPARAVNRSLDPALDAICRKAMAARPEDRYGAARALAEDLERWMADEAITAYPDRPLVATLRWFRHRPAARAWALALVIADVLLLLAWAGLFPLMVFLDRLVTFAPDPTPIYDPVAREIYNLNVRIKWTLRLTNRAIAAQAMGVLGGLIGLAMRSGRPRVSRAAAACGAAIGTVAGAVYGPRLGLALIRWLSNV